DHDPNNVTGPLPSPTIVFGNILNNDDLGSPEATITKISYNNIDTTAVNGVITIESINGTLVVYTITQNGHIAGDFSFALKTPTDHALGQGNNLLSELFHYTIS